MRNPLLQNTNTLEISLHDPPLQNTHFKFTNFINSVFRILSCRTQTLENQSANFTPAEHEHHKFTNINQVGEIHSSRTQTFKTSLQNPLLHNTNILDSQVCKSHPRRTQTFTIRVSTVVNLFLVNGGKNNGIDDWK